MKIDRVTLENFGVYAHKDFRFDSAPLVLIFGPNESGKTTALHGLRQAMFGFRPRGSYFMGRPMSACVTGQLSNGKPLEFKRKKGRPDDVSGTLAGRAISGDEVAQLLCNIDISSYEQLFGFSLDELRDGEGMLKNARLSDALAGGGLGGMQALQQLRAELQQSLADLYKSRGKNSTINVKLSELQRTQESLREHQVLPAAVEELQRNLAETRERSQAAKVQHRRYSERKLTIERLLKALPKYYELQATQHLLEGLDIPDGIDSLFAAQWGEYASQRQTLAVRLDEAKQQLYRDQHQLTQLSGSQEASTFEHEIEQLGHRSNEIPTVRTRLKQLEAEQRRGMAVCQQLLEQLELDSVSDSLRDFAVPPRHRKELTDMCEQYVALGKQKIAVQARLEEARDALQGLESGQTSHDFVPDNLPELLTLVKQLERGESELRDKARDLQSLMDDSETVRLREQICERLQPGVYPDPDWVPPSPDVIERFRSQFNELQTERKDVQRAAQQLERDAAVLHDQLNQLDRSGSTELRKSALALQSARDEILRQWLDELEQPLLAASISPHGQRERLLELQRLAIAADQLQTELLSAAETIAAVTQLEQQSERIQSDRRAQLTRGTELDEQLAATADQWHEQWKHLPVVLAEPACMLIWLQAFTQWREKTIQADRMRRQAHLQRSQLKNQRSTLLDAWPLSLKEDTGCEVLLAHLNRWETLQRDAIRDQQRLQTAQVNLNKLTQQLEQLESTQTQVLARYETWLGQVPIQIDWPLENVIRLLDCTEQLRREDWTLQQVTQQIDEHHSHLAEYTERVKHLAEQLGVQMDVQRPEGTAARWLTQLQEMRQEKSLRIQLTAAIAHNAMIVEETSTHLQGLDEKLAKLCSSVGSVDIAGMSSLVERVRRGEELRIKLSELAAALEPLAANTPFDQFQELLRETNEAALVVEWNELESELHTLDEARKEADQQVGSLCQRLEQLANNRVAQQHQQLLQNQRGELAELTEQWVVERMAQQLLTRAIERFSSAHEPALLGYTRQFLSKLTGGKYTSIEHDSAHPGSFTVRTADLQALPPEQLSTGTREQLYLAIRMAFITHHIEGHEPLPVIMDDCFVNFDDLRARHALEAISDWDERLQTILLSCHWRVVQILAEISPQTPAIHLERDTLTTVGELAAQQSSLLVP
jgi:uncharacterized protein YhaN